MESKSILERFNAEMQRKMVRLHGAVLFSGGKVVDEIYNGTYNRQTKTRMYSTSKSVTAIAIGKLVGEGKLSLDDKIVDIFSDRFDMSDIHPYLSEQTVRHMLKMTTCYSSSTYNEHIKDWLASYFRATPTHRAGTVWNYDSSGSYVLGAVTKQLTGLDFVEYLRPEFEAIGVANDVYCMKGPDGEAWASSAFIARTEDLARIAYLLLQGGKWDGKQLIPETFVREATSPLVINDDGVHTSHYNCGYGYQIWIHPEGAFAFHGLGGQVAIGFPGRDLVFACNSDTASNTTTYDAIFDAVESIILPSFPIVDKDAYDKAQPTRVENNCFDKIKNKLYILDKNPMGIDSVRFTSEGNAITLHYSRGEKKYEIPFIIDKESELIFPEKNVGAYLFNEDYYMNYRCSVIGKWLESNKLHIRVYAEDLYVGQMSMCFAFRDDGALGVKFDKAAQFFFNGFSGYTAGRVDE